MTTTEEPHYFVLSKRSSSYIFHRSYPIRDVETIPGTVQQLITRRLKWDLDTDIEIRYYLVPFVSNSHLLSGLPLTFSQPGEFHNGWTKSRIEQTVNDDYLESHCREIDLSDLGGGTQQNVIVVAIGAIIRVSFHVFVRTGPGEPITYAGYGDVRGDLGSIMDLAKEKAEEIAGRVEGMNTSPGACVTRVSKPKVSFTEAHLQNLASMGETSWASIAAPFDNGIPQDESWFIIDVVVHPKKYNYVMFRKLDSGYVNSGLGSMNALPEQLLEVLVTAARCGIEGFGFPPTARISIDVWAPEGDLETRPLKDWRVAKVTAENFGKDLTQCSLFHKFWTVPRTLVVVFTVSSLPLETVPEEGYDTDREVVAKLARKRDSPSSGAKLSKLLEVQIKSRKDAIYNSRPYELTGAPVQLYQPAFAKFIREISRPVKAGELPREELDGAAHFIDTSLSFFQDEAHRQTSLHNLDGALGKLTAQQINVDARVIKPDGTTVVPCPSAEKEAVVRIVELKNEVGEGDSDPIMQAECGFVLICSSEMYKPFRDASCCPMFLVGVVGPNLAVSGAIFTERFVSQRFTDYIYLGPLPSGGVESPMSHRIRRVAQILRALRVCTSELEDYYKNLEFQAPPASKSRRSQGRGISRSPAPTPSHPLLQKVPPPHFQAFTINNKTYKIEYTERLDRRYPSKAVFKGTIKCEGDKGEVKHVVIKFTDAYPAEAHKLLDEISLAPKLWFCNREESVEMHVVVMDYVRGKEVEDLLTGEKHIHDLRKAVSVLHERGYVHGDLRGPNILIAADGLKLIDFDWCGEAGKARYPADISVGSGIPWHNGVCREGLIEKEHDEHMITVLTSGGAEVFH